jgi:hypothetical protein
MLTLPFKLSDDCLTVPQSKISRRLIAAILSIQYRGGVVRHGPFDGAYD